MGTTEAIVAIIVALLSGGTARSVFLYFRDRSRERAEHARKVVTGAEDVEISAAATEALLKQIEAMTAAWDEERESYQARDQMRREHIAELTSELAEARNQLGAAQRALVEVSRQVESLTVRLASLVEIEGKEAH